MKKRVLAFLLATTLLFSGFATDVKAAELGEAVESTIQETEEDDVEIPVEIEAPDEEIDEETEEPTEEVVPEEEENLDEEAVEEETEEENPDEDSEEEANNASDYFSNVSMLFAGNELYVSAKLTIPSGATPYLRMLDSSGEKIYDYRIVAYRNEITNYSFCIAQDTAKCLLVMIQDSDKKELGKSSEFTRTNKPNLKLSAKIVSTGSASVTVDVALSGTYGTRSSYPGSTNSYKIGLYDANNKKIGSVDGRHTIQNGVQNETSRITFTGLTPNSKTVAYVKAYDEYTFNGPVIYDIASSQLTITTKEDKTYDLATEIPDEVLRANILSSIYKSPSATTVKASELEKLTYVYISRRKSSDPDVKNLKGLDLCTSVNSVSIYNTSVADISNVDWSKLKCLERLSLTGNDIKKVPSFKSNTMLYSVDFRENLLSDEEVSSIKNKFPANDHLSIQTSNQRTAGCQIINDATYYYNSSKATVFGFEYWGFRTSYGYTVKATIDDKITVNCSISSNNYFQNVKDLSAGKHKAKVELLEGEKVIDTRSFSFTVAEAPENLVTKQFVYEQGYSAIYAYFACRGSQTPKEIKIYDPSGKELKLNSDYKIYNDYGKLNLSKISYLDSHLISQCGYKCYYLYGSTNAVELSAGNYSAVLYDENKAKICTLNNVMLVAGQNQAYIRDASGNAEGKNDNLYYNIYVYGNVPDFSKLNYSIKNNGVITKLTYVASKKNHGENGYTVRLKKEKASNRKQEGSTLVITGDATYFPQKSFETLLHDEAYYYCAYNGATKQLELGVYEDLLSAPAKINGEVFTSKYDFSTGKSIVTTIGTYNGVKASDGLYYGKIIDSKGKSVDLEDYTLYYIKFNTLTGEQSASFQATPIKEEEGGNSSGGTSTYSAYWYDTQGAVGKKFNVHYYSSIPYSDVSKHKLTGYLVLNDSTVNLKATPSKKVTNGTAYVMYTLTIDATKIPSGVYTLRLVGNGKEYSQTEINIQPTNKFVMESCSASWENSSTLKLTVYSANSSLIDTTYSVELTTLDGKKVEGLSTKFSYWINSGIALEITGLNRKNAEKEYYIKVKHTKLGEPVDVNGNKYYKDSKGEKRTIYASSGSFMYSNTNKVCGVYFPLDCKKGTVYVYDKMNMNIVYKKEIGNGERYAYFDKSFASVINPSTLYDLVFVADTGVSLGIDNVIVSYKDFSQSSPVAEETDNTWNATIDKTKLYTNLDPSEALITVTAEGTKSYVATKPSATSSDTGVATVAVNPKDPKQFTVTAVAPGTAKITVKFGKESKEFDVTVSKYTAVSSILLSKEETTINAGSKETIGVSIQPTSASTKGTYTITSSSEAVATASIDTYGKYLTINGVAAGTATITVTYKDTNTNKTYTAKCKVNVNGKYTTEELTAIKAKATKVYVLTNTMPKVIKLGDIAAPSGFKWAEGTEGTVLKADAQSPIQYFMAEYTAGKANYETVIVQVPVCVSTFNGLGIKTDRANFYPNNKTANIELLPKFAGYVPTADEFGKGVYKDIVIANETAEAAPLKLTKSTNYKYTATSNTVEANTKAQIKFTATIGTKKFPVAAINVTVFKDAVVNKIVIEDQAKPETSSSTRFNNTLNAYLFEYALKDIEAKGTTIKLNVRPSVSGTATTTPVKWTSSDPTIAAVSVDKAGNVNLLVKKKGGSAVITATAQDNGKFAQKLVVNVKDYSPVLLSNSYVATAIGPKTKLDITGQNGSKITAVKVDEKNVENYAITASNGLFYLSPKKADLKKSNKVTLTVSSSLNGTALEDKTFVITVNNNNNPPKAVVKQTLKANVFLKAATAELYVSSTAKVTGVAMNGTIETGYVISSFDAATGKVTLKAKGLTADNQAAFVKGTYAKVPVKITYEGYTNAVEAVLTVAAVNEYIKYDVKNLAFLNGSNTITTPLLGDGNVIKNSTVTVKSLTTGATASYNKTTGNITVTRTDAKLKTITYEINDTTFVKPVTLTRKLADAPKQTLVASTKAITLNSSAAVTTTSSEKVLLSYANNSTSIKTIDLKANNAASQKLLDNDAIVVTKSPAGGTLYVSINNGNKAKVKAGKYAFTIATLDANGVESTTAPLTVQITNAAPKATVTLKGSINVLDRANTFAAVNVKLANIDGAVANIKISGGDSALFYAKKANDVWGFYARTGYKLDSRKQYKFNATFVLTNGAELTAPVALKVASVMPKLTADKKSLTLYKSNTSMKGEFNVSSSNANVKISKIEGVNNNEAFTLTISGGKITVALNDKCKNLKPGNYTISYKITLTDSAVNVQPVTQKITVVVK